MRKILIDWNFLWFDETISFPIIFHIEGVFWAIRAATTPANCSWLICRVVCKFCWSELKGVLSASTRFCFALSSVALSYAFLNLSDLLHSIVLLLIRTKYKTLYLFLSLSYFFDFLDDSTQSSLEFAKTQITSLHII